jgi:hypothetical protein
MKYLPLAVLLGAASPAWAQAPDELCATLDKVLATVGDKPVPFGTLGTDGKAPLDAQGKVPSFFSVAKLPGLADARTCRVDVAGSTYGSATGDARDKFECELFDVGEKSDPDARTTADAMAKTMSGRVKACLTPKGWTAAAPATESGGRDRDLVWQFTKANSKTKAEVRFNTFVYGRTPRDMEEQYKVTIAVITEVPNKYVPKTPPAEPNPNR